MFEGDNKRVLSVVEYKKQIEPFGIQLSARQCLKVKTKGFQVLG